MALIIEQWRSGREFARRDTFAAQMVNFTYLIGDDTVMQAWLVDPAWDVRGILDLVRRRLADEDRTLVGLLQQAGVGVPT